MSHFFTPVIGVRVSVFILQLQTILKKLKVLLYYTFNAKNSSKINLLIHVKNIRCILY